MMRYQRPGNIAMEHAAENLELRRPPHPRTHEIRAGTHPIASTNTEGRMIDVVALASGDDETCAQGVLLPQRENCGPRVFYFARYA